MIRLLSKVIHNFRATFALRTMSSINLNFDNLVHRALPLDTSKINQPRQVKGACFSLVDISPCENPELVAHSREALELIGVTEQNVESEDFVKYFAGNEVMKGSQPAAHCYCGHQFGSFAGQLGDGAAMYLGEIVNDRNERWELQLKGSGRTPFSRSADGRKVLRSSIREFLCSEAMHHLGVPTTRAGTCITSDSKVVRDIFYDGNAKYEKCTIISRIAPTFLRFGSFEIFKAEDPLTRAVGPSVGRQDILDQMLDYTIKNFYPQLWKEAPEDREDMILEFYNEVLRRTAKLVAHWQAVGWCHGVLNTDNMSILGLTIDYGPYGFMDRFDPNFICNGSDDNGRYTYQNQPEMVRWNCTKLAESIQMSLPLDKSRHALKIFNEVYDDEYIGRMRNKLGLQVTRQGDMHISTTLLNVMYESGCDFTNGFKSLEIMKIPGSDGYDQSKTECLKELLKQCCTPQELADQFKIIDNPWIAQIKAELQRHPGFLDSEHPIVKMIQKEDTKREKYDQLKSVTVEEKAEKDSKLWLDWLNKYESRLNKEKSDSKSLSELNKIRADIMQRANPRVVLRNHIAQKVIEAAENGDYEPTRRLLDVLRDPYHLNQSREKTETTQQSADAAQAAAACSTESELPHSYQWYCMKPPPNSHLVVT